jgi:hypothetical protein
MDIAGQLDYAVEQMELVKESLTTIIEHIEMTELDEKDQHIAGRDRLNRYMALEASWGLADNLKGQLSTIRQRSALLPTLKDLNKA